ncbi:toll/interleukin-1 receptor domain-containing protein [Hoeflea sp.]|uniref:toll/interleukin-1 receptor domain-containing protein n=1 Tax=Hoeflea sp. TaxID=1940281 RepID=UPI003A940EF4
MRQTELTFAASSKIRVFISYSRADSKRVDELYKSLADDEELEVFLDRHDIAAAEDWNTRLAGLIRSADAIIFILSPASTASKVCRWEIEEAERLNKRIIPVVIKAVPNVSVPSTIARLNFLFARTTKEHGLAVGAIQSALKVDIGWIREHTRLLELGHRWSEAKKLGAQPLRGKELEAAERWAATRPRHAPALTEVHRDYIFESRRAANRRQRFAVGGTLVALMIVSVLAAFAFQQRNAALEGERRAKQAFNATQVSVGDFIFSMVQRFRNTDLPRSITYDALQQMNYIIENIEQNFPDTGQVPRNTYLSYVEMANFYQQDNDPTRAKHAINSALNAVNGRDLKNDIVAMRDKLLISKNYIQLIIGTKDLLPEMARKNREKAISIISEMEEIEDTLRNSEYYGFEDEKSEIDTIGIKMEMSYAEEDYGKVAILHEEVKALEAALSRKYSGNELLEMVEGELLWNGMIRRRMAAVSLALTGRAKPALAVIEEAIAMFERFGDTMEGERYSQNINDGFLADLIQVKSAIQREI